MKFLHRFLSFLLLSSLLLLLMAGCRPEEKQDSGSILNIQIENGVQTLDPQKAHDGTAIEVIACITDGLTQPDAGGHPVPALAESWEIDSTQKVWTFHLRKGALWSQTGDPVTAYDFVYAWQRAIDPKTASTYAYLLADVAQIENAAEIVSGRRAPDSLGAEAVDEHTLTVRLKTPCPYFLDLLTLPVFYPVEQAFLDECGENYATSPETLQSNGAFIMENYAPYSTHFSLRKNDDYWDAGRVSLSELHYHWVRNSREALNGYRSGALDYISLSGAETAAVSDSADLVTFDTGYLWYLALNFRNDSVLNNRNLRMALSSAIDRETMTAQAVNDSSKAAYFIVPDNIATNEEGLDFRVTGKDFSSDIAYDVARAQACLEDAKAECGVSSFEFDLLTDTTQADTVAAILKQQIEQALPSVHINIISMEKAQLNEALSSGTFELALTRWGADYPDPTAYLGICHSQSPINYGGWSSEVFDALLAKSTEAIPSENSAVRWNLLYQAESIAVKDLAIIPIYEKRTAALVRPAVSGLRHHVVGLGNVYKDVRIAEEDEPLL